MPVRVVYNCLASCTPNVIRDQPIRSNSPKPIEWHVQEGRGRAGKRILTFAPSSGYLIQAAKGQDLVKMKSNQEKQKRNGESSQAHDHAPKLMPTDMHNIARN